jgi:hypothetical protein
MKAVPLHVLAATRTPLNLMALLDAWEMLGKRPLERDFARAMVRIRRNESLEEWLASFPERSFDPEKAKKLIHFVRDLLEPEEKIHSPEDNLTFSDTANRAYEEAYWNEIYFMAHGKFVNKDNADVVEDQETLRMTVHRHRDLQKLGDYLMSKHREAITAAGMDGKAEVGEMPFTGNGFEFRNMEVEANQEGSEYERNILVIIPGKSQGGRCDGRSLYTAYMGDVFDRERATGRGYRAAGR